MRLYQDKELRNEWVIFLVLAILAIGFAIVGVKK
jgi:nitrate reductase NapE component